MIRTGRIVNFIGPAGNGKFGAQTVKIAFHDARFEVNAYAKRLTELEFLVELMAALMGIEMGLPIPEPVAAVSENNEVWFASVDMKFPDLSRHLTVANNQIQNTAQNVEILRRLANWPAIQQAIGFDEWIANGDRNIGNVLFDGKDRFYLIDHNRAMRPPFAPEAPIENALLNTKLTFTQDELGRHRLKHQIEALVGDFNPALPQAIADRLSAQISKIDDAILNGMVDFLNQRLNHLTAITHQKIATQQVSL
jgi:hypothetical protein